MHPRHKLRNFPPLRISCRVCPELHIEAIDLRHWSDTKELIALLQIERLVRNPDRSAPAMFRFVRSQFTRPKTYRTQPLRHGSFGKKRDLTPNVATIAQNQTESKSIGRLRHAECAKQTSILNEPNCIPSLVTIDATGRFAKRTRSSSMLKPSMLVTFAPSSSPYSGPARAMIIPSGNQIIRNGSLSCGLQASASPNLRES